MADITTFWIVEGGEGGWRIASPALASGDDLQTATIISLFTDRQAEIDDVPPGVDRRGWWGEPTMGSRLWLLARAKVRDETLRLTEEYAREALAWMVEDGVVSRVTASAAWAGRTALALTVSIFRRDGSSLPLSFAVAWDGATP